MKPVEAQVDVKKLPNWRAVWRPGSDPLQSIASAISLSESGRSMPKLNGLPGVCRAWVRAISQARQTPGPRPGSVPLSRRLQPTKLLTEEVIEMRSCACWLSGSHLIGQVLRPWVVDQAVVKQQICHHLLTNLEIGGCILDGIRRKVAI